MVILILFAFVVLCITVDAVVQNSRKRKAKLSSISVVTSRSFTESSISAPKGVFYDKTHTWAFMEKNGLVKIGVDDFILHITGPLHRVKMKGPGEIIRKGEPIMSLIQSGKHLILNSPISGTIKYNNKLLTGDSSALNTSPYNDGWVYAVEPSNWLRDMQFLIMDDKYMDWLKNEFSRLKDFLASGWKPNDTVLVPVMLQDGGEIKDNLLADMGPEMWEEFQINFLNTPK